MKSEQKPLSSPSRHLFSEEYRRMICEHYLNGNSSKEEIRVQFGIKGKSSLLYWLRKFGYVNPKASQIRNYHLWQNQKKRLLKLLNKRMKI